MTGSLLEALVGEELGSVTFVQDYLQLDFSSARLTVFVWPTVTVEGISRGSGAPGYRDALCALIAHEVTETEESPEAGLRVKIGSSEVVVNPVATDVHGPEIAMLQVHGDGVQDARWAVWRPGEDIFATRG